MIIGLTGGIAAGKSAVRHILASQPSLETFDADACVHRLLDSDPQVAAAIQNLFGPAFLREDGKPDRRALREHVFRSPQARRDLEALLHPRVREEWQDLRAQCLAANRNFLADIPLFYETGAEALFDAIVVVACSEATQLSRLQARGLEPEMAKAMLASQLPLGQKVERAAFVLWNDGSLAALGRQTRLLANLLFAE